MAQLDPTRPPPGWLPGQAQKATSAEPAPEEGAPGARIVVGGASRQFVMLGGQAVRVGENYNGARLLSIGPDGPIWQREGKREVASLSPGVRKTAPAVHGLPQGGEPAAARSKKQNESKNGEGR